MTEEAYRDKISELKYANEPGCLGVIVVFVLATFGTGAAVFCCF